MEREKIEHHTFRLVFMIIFWLFLRISLLVTGFVCIVQWVVLWFQEEPLEPLHQFVGTLRLYQSQILAYINFETEQKVFPFAPWPAAHDDS